MASPVVHPRVMQLICSEAGAYRLVVQGDANGGVAQHHTLECAMCVMGGGAPLVLDVAVMATERAMAVRPQPLLARPIAARPAVLPPARGPPKVA